MTAYDDLMAFQRDTTALGQVAGRLGWDQETVMPRGAAGQRSEEMAALESILHGRRADPRVGDWLDQATTDDPVAQAQLREIRRSYDRATKLPARLSAELARETSLAQGIWAQARAAEDFSQFAPSLSRVIALKQEEAAALADGGSLYDALLDDYEPGATAASIGVMFDDLRPGLVALREKILGSTRDMPRLQGSFDTDEQFKLSQTLARAFGYDLNRGRIDRAVHPFSSGSGSDVRITTRTDPADPFNCFYSTIHEVGHASYEQGIEDQYALTPLGCGVSMGVHESQSRIYENQLGRSRAFTGWLYARMVEVYGAFGVADADAFYAAVNGVRPGFIRTEADEVHYNLHVMMRFDLEQALLTGDLSVDDLPGAWNDRFAADFGVAVDTPSNGVLQDVHWSVGLIGYFPTYTLGNVYAGCLYESLGKAVPDLDAELAAGNTSSATGWLRDHVQRHGGLYRPVDLITRATGGAPSVQPLLRYLETKFSQLYDL
ncbi:carboxypeptidase M32 [Actibacterium sp. 188UL27-1]|uniref:carboxypeptidase M32 n=1 Tax=Actibacterium sp. 188UL27-1 TaxID=2786961 RepID=UPI00195E410F|nr:carboxypeptidase M32 [Actibacterium sp. 188UL27-1]MBM7067598.1 carboxypeptidase M32 [Actibacterium sp. 188UL27-1]